MRARQEGVDSDYLFDNFLQFSAFNRQVSTTETMAATRGPASSLAIRIQFLLLWKNSHNRKNWLHVGSERAGPRVADILPVVET